MYKKPRFADTSLAKNESVEGETIEQELARYLNNGEPTEDVNVKLHYSERKDGVIDAYNIRTDKWEIAIEGHTRIAKSVDARRDQRNNPPEEEEKGGEDGKPESV